MVSTIPDSINSVMIIFMGILIGFMGPTLNCQIQEMMFNSAIARHFALLLIIYFTISLTAKSGEHPGALIGNALVIYMGYVLLTKQNKYFLFTNLAIIMIMFTMIQVRDYYNNIKKDEDKVETYEKYIGYLQIVLVVCVLAGFVAYVVTQARERGVASAKNAFESFSPVKFWFGTNQCDFTQRTGPKVNVAANVKPVSATYNAPVVAANTTGMTSMMQ